MSSSNVDDEEIQFVIACLKQEMEQIDQAIAELQKMIAVSVDGPVLEETMAEQIDQIWFVMTKRGLRPIGAKMADALTALTVPPN